MKWSLTNKRLLINVTAMKLWRQADRTVFRAVADATRRALLDRLAEADCSVTELRRGFRISQPAVSQHLRILRQAGLVRAHREGRLRRYHLNAAPIAEVYRWAATYRRFFDPMGHAWTFRKAPRKIQKEDGHVH